MKFVDISYYYNRTDKPEALLETHRPNLGYFDHLPADWKCTLIKFAESEGRSVQERFDYYHFKGNDSKLWAPMGTNRFVARLKPDVVMVHGLIFPQQVLLLRAQLSGKCKIIIQHHAERPAKGMMGKLQRLADRCVDGYLFASKELAAPWIEQGVIKEKKVFEVMEGSSVMQRMDKRTARMHLNIGDEPVFLWVGRLDNNKNPQTVLTAFDEYLRVQPGAKLYMVYGDYEDKVISLMQQMIADSCLLRKGVVLLGKLGRSELAYWYNAADYYVSASYSEGSGYALIEAMSCGCIPVVSGIPSFRKITDNGRVGMLFNPGSVPSLVETLHKLKNLPITPLVPEVLTQFENELSFKAIARQLHGVCESVMRD